MCKKPWVQHCGSAVWFIGIPLCMGFRVQITNFAKASASTRASTQGSMFIYGRVSLTGVFNVTDTYKYII